MIRLVNSNGATVASYEYDPYGKVISAMGSMAAINPLRYRGYYYDQETGLYFLMSRYYDPAICRFINADEYASTGQGLLGFNMFAYCRNNPAIRVDASGTDDLCALANADDNPFDDLAAFTGGGGYSYGVSFATSMYSSLYSGGIYNLGYTPYYYNTPSTAANQSSNQSAEPLLSIEYYANKNAPIYSTPYDKRVTYKYNSHTETWEKSTACYDFAGRQIIRIDWTNHGYSNHGLPHVHIRTYSNTYPMGLKQRMD